MLSVVLSDHVSPYW